jgi:predicted transcriptional regulator
MPYLDGMHKTTLYLEDDLRERIARVAKATGRSQAEVIRDALREYLSRRKRPRSIGLGKGGPDLGDRVEELLQGFGES